MIHEIMGIWFGSMHTLATATAYAMMDLAMHQDHIEALREEVNGEKYKDFESTTEGLPLLDSFIKESARMTAFDAGKRPRKL